MRYIDGKDGFLRWVSINKPIWTCILSYIESTWLALLWECSLSVFNRSKTNIGDDRYPMYLTQIKVKVYSKAQTIEGEKVTLGMTIWC